MSEKKQTGNESYNKDLFYEYGANPNYKNLVEMMQDNTYKGGYPNLKTFVFGKPQRWFPFRDLDDFLEKEMRVYSFPRSLPFVLASMTFFMLSLHHLTTYLPVGRFGYTRFNQTPFYKTWGKVGLIGAFTYPLVMGYFFVKTTIFSGKLFYNRVIMQERNWMFENIKFTNPHGNYHYSDSYLSSDKAIPNQAQIDIKAGSLPDAMWFKNQ